MDEQDARDMLIRIDTKVSLLYENFTRHQMEDAGNRQAADDSIKAAHRRLDGFLLSGILTIILMIGGFTLQIFLK